MGCGRVRQVAPADDSAQSSTCQASHDASQAFGGNKNDARPRSSPRDAVPAALVNADLPGAIQGSCKDATSRERKGTARKAESLYERALREMEEHGSLERTTSIDDPTWQLDASMKSQVSIKSKLEASMTCTRGPGGVKALSFTEDPLLMSQTWTAAQASPLAICGQKITWVRGDVLGQGSLGSVFCALEQFSGQVIAVKEVLVDESDKSEMELKAALENEVSILKDLKHPSIVSYLGHDYIDSSLYIYLEYMPGGSLTQLMASFGAFEEHLAAVYARELLEGLEYLHSRRPPVLHRDIKGGNVLVSADCHVKLADFGCSKRHTDTLLTRTMKGSIPWMAPEVILQTGYGLAADVWSFGCVVLEMVTASSPWGSFDNPLAACYRIAMSNETPAVPESLSKTCQDFLDCCLRRDAVVRLSARELLLHAFVSELDGAAPERRGAAEFWATAPEKSELLDLLD
eukprot:TRINITY_DN22223_c0_g2_i1.p1 TRINITY_DN22223_c0_g2~~TRINITY_DN22223_c0_g2_i1.p1  ORF type:complete len:472 (+),score=83.81 TRINITY_DN22223_c0_g2_i1:39-1418(+)